jgi:hypothetical protein
MQKSTRNGENIAEMRAKNACAFHVYHAGVYHITGLPKLYRILIYLSGNLCHQQTGKSGA